MTVIQTVNPDCPHGKEGKPTPGSNYQSAIYESRQQISTDL